MTKANKNLHHPLEHHGHSSGINMTATAIFLIAEIHILTCWRGTTPLYCSSIRQSWLWKPTRSHPPQQCQPEDSRAARPDSPAHLHTQHYSFTSLKWVRFCCSAYMTHHVRCVYMIWISLSMQSCSLSCQLRSSATHKAMRDSLSSLARNGHSTCTVLTLCSERGKKLTHTKNRISRNVTNTLLARLTFLLKIYISTK